MEQTSLSVIIPVGERAISDQANLYRLYRTALRESSDHIEFIYVVDGARADAERSLEEISRTERDIRVIRLAKTFGEATALTIGFDEAKGQRILMLPAYEQVEPSDVASLVEALDEQDMAVARRHPRIDPGINQLQAKVFHWLLGKVTGERFSDLGCGARAFRREVVQEIPLYGDQHRFMPLLALRRGFRVKEVDVRQSKADDFRRFHGPGVYVRRTLDLFTVFFLVKFTKKPLRFFGLVGSAVFGIGGAIMSYLIVERLFFGVALADRPALLLTSLLVVLGIQVIAVGLIGELIIFTHAREMREYTVDEVVN